MAKSGKSSKDDLTGTLQHLLQTKDNINARLLAETKHNSELANQISIAEAKIRELTETTLRNIRSGFEKKKSRSSSIVGRLESMLKELQKSERTLSNKKLHKTNRHSEVKRANRRIKDAEKMIKDGPRPDKVDTMFEAMAEQVTRLCQQLMQVPMIFSVHASVSGNPTTKSPAFIDHSDHSDSDSSEKDTNGSNSNVRPRANSDSRIEGTVNSKRRRITIMNAFRFKHHENGTEHDNRPRNDSDSYQNKWYTDRFEAIGYFPNDSESSDGSFRGESPGPLRGFTCPYRDDPHLQGVLKDINLPKVAPAAFLC